MIILANNNSRLKIIMTVIAVNNVFTTSATYQTANKCTNIINGINQRYFGTIYVDRGREREREKINMAIISEYKYHEISF